MRLPERPRRNETEQSPDSNREINLAKLIPYFVIPCVACFFLMYFFMFNSDEEPKNPIYTNEVMQKEPSPVETVIPRAEPENNQNKSEPKNFYGIGEYKIGTDIPAGEYLAVGDGYIELKKNSTGKIGSIVLNDIINDTQRYIEARDGEYLIVSGDLKLYRENEAPKNDTKEKIPAGHYKVGIDIPAGEYKVDCEDGAYVAVEKNSRGSIETNRVARDASSLYITVFDGQYLKLVRAEAHFVGVTK